MGRGVNGVFHVCNTTVNTLTHHNLPYDLVVNSCSMAPKARRVQVILINTTDQNIWVRQPLLATELYEAEVKSQSFTVKGMKLPYHSCWHLHMRDKNKWRIIQWRWKKIQIHQRKIMSQWNIQSLGKGLTLGRPMI